MLSGDGEAGAISAIVFSGDREISAVYPGEDAVTEEENKRKGTGGEIYMRRT